MYLFFIGVIVLAAVWFCRMVFTTTDIKRVHFPEDESHG